MRTLVARSLSSAVVLLLALPMWAGRGHWADYARQGGNTVSVAGFQSLTPVDRTFPSATVSVYKQGTVVLATVYADAGGTAKANPFTAGLDARIDFYSDEPSVDITFSGTGITTGCGGAGQVACLVAFTWANQVANTATSAGTFNAKDYGAVCDGTTNDAIAITAALAAANTAGGGTIQLPAGTCVTNSTITIPGSNISLQGQGEGISIIKAGASQNFQYVLSASSFSNVSIRQLTVDVNQANRAASLSTVGSGILLLSVTDGYVAHVTTQNAIGTGALSGVGLVVNSSTRVRVEHCTFLNNGVAGKTADGLYMNGTFLEASDIIAVNCLDSGVAFENYSYSSLNGFTGSGNGSAVGVSCNQNADCPGLVIQGVQENDWLAGTTVGGLIQLVSASGTGNIVDTAISNVVGIRTVGGGQAIYSRQSAGTGRFKNLRLHNVSVYSSVNVGAQALLIDKADGVEVVGGYFQTGSNSVAIQFQSGCTLVKVIGATVVSKGIAGILGTSVTDGQFIGNRIDGSGGAGNNTYGIELDTAATDVYVASNHIKTGTGGTPTGVYFPGANTRCSSVMNYVDPTNVASGNNTTGTGVYILTITGDGMLFLAPTLIANLGTPANGIFTYCSDCTKATPCAGGGTGAWAKRLNGAWDCN